MTLEDILRGCPKDPIIGDNLVLAYSKINHERYEKILCSVSGGADSDIVVDIVTKCDNRGVVDYVWLNTGLEYQATKDHLKYLEDRYKIKIRTCDAIKPIPQSCRERGVPFISKQVSENIYRLMRHGFAWEDLPLAELLAKYCKWDPVKQDYTGCKSALRWWCNDKSKKLNIAFNKGLKDFLMTYPPTDFGIRISAKCCDDAKKDPVHKFLTAGGYDLDITGIRKAEGGTRSTSYTSCFSARDNSYDSYRPVYYYKDAQKRLYNRHYGIQNSRCYSAYGLDRTGCAGCPFGRYYEHELTVLREYEPKLYTAATNIFGRSYEYMRLYEQFRSKN